MPRCCPRSAALARAFSLTLCGGWSCWRVLCTRLCACQRFRQFTHTHTSTAALKQNLCLLLTFCAKDITDIAQLPLPTLPSLLAALLPFGVGWRRVFTVAVVVAGLLFHSRHVLISVHPLVVLVIPISIFILCRLFISLYFQISALPTRPSLPLPSPYTVLPIPWGFNYAI